MPGLSPLDPSPLAETPATASAGSIRPAQAARSTPISWILAASGFLVLLVGLVFGQTVRFEFLTYDDDRFVYENPHIAPGLTPSGLWYAFADSLTYEMYPITSLSHMLDCQFYGLKPGRHHLTNLLIHALSSVLLLLALVRMTGDFWPSAWVAAVFAVHPLHVSSVAWVFERRELLAGLFFMLMLLAYARFAERPSLGRYFAVFGCLALGLMSKPTVVTAPFVLLLLDYWPLGRFRPSGGASPPAEPGWWLRRLPIPAQLVLEKLPLLALSAASCAVTLSTHYQSDPNTIQVDPLPLPARIANALVSYVAYIGQSFYPVGLSPHYPHRGTQLPLAWALEAFALLGALTAVVLIFRRGLPFLLVGWLWFLGVLVPCLGLVGAFFQSRADNYTYLSQIGLSIAVAWSVWSAYRWRQSLRGAALAEFGARDPVRSVADGAFRRRLAADGLLAQYRGSLDESGCLHRATCAGPLLPGPCLRGARPAR